MTNERDYLLHTLQSPPKQFANIVKAASGETERVLRTHFGDARFTRMQSLAANVTDRPTGNVVMLPGILGSELYEGDEHIWLSPWNIIRGDFDQLQVDSSGASIKAITAPNMLKKYYGEMQLALLGKWNVVSFPFDWRLDIRDSARKLKTQIDTLLGSTAPFSIAAHSMGGLVARSYLQQFPSDWQRIQKFIMMGTPNYGSFAISVLYNGLNDVMKMVALLDQQHYMPDLLQFAKQFVGTYQMLPFIGKTADAARLMDPAVYGDLNPPQSRFNNAQNFATEIAATLDQTKMVYIAGFGFKTVDAIADWGNLKSWDGYHQTLAGDGTVPHSLGLIAGIDSYFVQVEHSLLPGDGTVIQAVDDIISTGNTTKLPNAVPNIGTMHQAMLKVERTTESSVRTSRAHLLREIVRLERLAHPDKVSSSEAELQDLIFSSFGVPQRAFA